METWITTFGLLLRYFCCFFAVFQHMPHSLSLSGEHQSLQKVSFCISQYREILTGLEQHVGVNDDTIQRNILIDKPQTLKQILHIGLASF